MEKDIQAKMEERQRAWMVGWRGENLWRADCTGSQ